mmetsp:Transcript_42948/g.100900  ORF Transcript_42948/g.100900 Transcript_42948/m.100900 type:complete len:470 (-) Transcript_42948:220-1629(-)
MPKASTQRGCDRYPKGEPKAVVTPVLTKPLMPTGFDVNLCPLVCILRSSKLAAARSAAATTFFGVLALPATYKEKSLSKACWLKSHSTAFATAPSFSNSGASANCTTQLITAEAHSSSASVPKSFPNLVPATSSSAILSLPPKAATWERRSTANGPANVTTYGCTCLMSFGTSTGLRPGKSSDALTMPLTIFFVKLGRMYSFATEMGFSPLPMAAKTFAKRAHSCKPTGLHSITSLPLRSCKQPPAPSFQMRLEASAFGISYLHSRCWTRASKNGSISAPSLGPSATMPSSRRSALLCGCLGPADTPAAHGSDGDLTHWSRGATAAIRSRGPTPVFQCFSISGACSLHCRSRIPQSWTTSWNFLPGSSSNRLGSSRSAARACNAHIGNGSGSSSSSSSGPHACTIPNCRCRGVAFMLTACGPRRPAFKSLHSRLATVRLPCLLPDDSAIATPAPSAMADGAADLHSASA